MEDFDLSKSFDELLKPTDPSKGAALESTTEVPVTSLESILPHLPPEGQAWLNGLNRFCRRAVEHDLRAAGGSLFATPCKSSNVTSDLPITGSSLTDKARRFPPS
jgi:hypothetical protein